MKNTFKVLSIDFDFFQNVTQQQLDNYPDGIDVPSGISKIIWASHYMTSDLHNITIDLPLFDKMCSILSNQFYKTPIMITNSHVHIYDFIMEHFNQKDIELYNIDLHHDLTNNNDELDCGNWIKHLMADTSVKHFEWIARQISIDCYDISNIINQLNNVQLDFHSIQNEQFDCIFLCRSDPWLPPHLDVYFDEMLQLCKSLFVDIRAEKTILKPRDMTDVSKIEHQMRTMCCSHID